jgi:rod shape-determining protein MreC
MRRKHSKAYLFLFVTLLAVMSIPKESTVKLQGATVAVMAPAWSHLLAIKSLLFSNETNENTPSPTSLEEIEKLRLENTLLHEEIIYLKEVMQHEIRLLNQINTAIDKENPVSTKALKSRHRLELQKLLQMNLESVPAKVIFRSPDSWNSSFWINVGTHTNESLGNATVAKNSPVLLGSAVIGVIDYVGKHQSRVRLITDSGLTPSIRTVRGNIQNKVFDEKIHNLIQLLKKTPHALDSPEQQQELISHLESASKHLSGEGKTSYLAKGELYGSSKPLWRSQRHELKGIGFNYDFSDGEGPARDLRTGDPIGLDHEGASEPIVEVGDLLVTTGMDGVFPAGLLVAEVSKVHPLKEGDYFYELDAFPVAGNFDDISHVFVIPPVNYDPDEHPPAYGWK